MVTYTINGAILEVKGDGAYATADIAAVLAEAKTNPAFPVPTYLLIDIRESAIIHRFPDVRDRLLLIQQQLGSTLAPFVAFVASGLARERLAQLYRARAATTGEIEVEVFTDLQTARDWLLSRG